MLCPKCACSVLISYLSISRSASCIMVNCLPILLCLLQAYAGMTLYRFCMLFCQAPHYTLDLMSPIPCIIIIDTIPRVERVSTGENVQLRNSNDYYALGGDSIRIYCYCIPEKYVHFFCTVWHYSYTVDHVTN